MRGDQRWSQVCFYNIDDLGKFCKTMAKGIWRTVDLSWERSLHRKATSLSGSAARLCRQTFMNRSVDNVSVKMDKKNITIYDVPTMIHYVLFAAFTYFPIHIQCACKCTV